MKKRDHEDVWRKRLSGWERTGLSHKEFCDNERVTEATFYMWRRRLSANGSKPKGKVEFVEVTEVCLVTNARQRLGLSPIFTVRECSLRTRTVRSWIKRSSKRPSG